MSRFPLPPNSHSHRPLPPLPPPSRPPSTSHEQHSTEDISAGHSQHTSNEPPVRVRSTQINPFGSNSSKRRPSLGIGNNSLQRANSNPIDLEIRSLTRTSSNSTSSSTNSILTPSPSILSMKSESFSDSLKSISYSSMMLGTSTSTSFSELSPKPLTSLSSSSSMDHDWSNGACQLTFLTCGYSATGVSSMVTLYKPNTENGSMEHGGGFQITGHSSYNPSTTKIACSILVNAGDGTQRFCSEHRIKLNHIRVIVLNSLAPHSISGFPGVFLALSDLGVGEITVYGPSGLRACLQAMSPFINRRFPVLRIVEVEKDMVETIRGGEIRLKPVYLESSVIAVAACISPLSSDGKTSVAESVSFLPTAYYFPTSPSTSQLVRWATGHEEYSNSTDLSSDEDDDEDEDDGEDEDGESSDDEMSETAIGEKTSTSDAVVSLTPDNKDQLDEVICDISDSDSDWSLDGEKREENKSLKGNSYAALVETQHNSPTTVSWWDNAVVFVPLAAASRSCDRLTTFPNGRLASAIELSDLNSKQSSYLRSLADLCTETKAIGIILPNTVSAAAIEFEYTQTRLSQLNFVCAALFPRPLQSFEKLSDALFPTNHSSTFVSPQIHCLMEVPLLFATPLSSCTLAQRSPDTIHHLMKRDVESSDLVFQSSESTVADYAAWGVALRRHNLENFISRCQRHRGALEQLLCDTERSLSVRLTARFDANILAQLTRCELDGRKSMKRLNSSIKNSQSNDNTSRISLIARSESSDGSSFLTNEVINSPNKSETSVTLKRPRSQKVSNSDMDSGSCIDSPVSTDSSDFEGESNRFSWKRRALDVDDIDGGPLSPMHEDQFFPPAVNNTFSDQRNPFSRAATTNGIAAMTSQVQMTSNHIYSPMQKLSSNHNHRRALQDCASVPVDGLENDYLSVTFLGTGCATPSKFRSNSAILLAFTGPPGILPRPLSRRKQPPPPTQLSAELPSFLKRRLAMAAAKQITTVPPISITMTDSNEISIDDLDTPALNLPTTKDSPPTLTIPSAPITPPTLSLPKHAPPPLLVPDSLSDNTDTPAMDEDDAVDTIVPAILMDVGEGTSAQLFQSAGGDLDRFDELLLGLRIIWVSHHHADHSTGLPMLLQHIDAAQRRQRRHWEDSAASFKLVSTAAHPSLTNMQRWDKYTIRHDNGQSFLQEFTPSKVLIIASEQVLRFVQHSAVVAGLADLAVFHPIVSTHMAGMTREVALTTGGRVTRLQSIPVYHCRGSYGLVLTLANGERIVYSGDCRPSQSLVKSGQNAALLIHEATFDDSMTEDAIQKKHSTVGEAVEMARQMRAKHLILTHFSQRYPLVGSSTSHSASMESTDQATMACDMLKFSFPSQVMKLAQATDAVTRVLQAAENIQDFSAMH